MSISISSTRQRLSQTLVAAVLSGTLALTMAACGGSAKSIGAAGDMPSSATAKAMDKAEACDDGDLDACNSLGIWFMVGGAGKERRNDGIKYISHACDEGLDKACKHLNALRKAAN
jgi:hypothetical protein